MSRIANQPVVVDASVQVNITDTLISVKGAKGLLEREFPRSIAIVQDGQEVKVSAQNKTKESKAMSGTFRALIQNMVTGVNQGFSKTLKLVGVGYRASLQGNDLNLNLGFSHPVVFKAPEGISFKVDKQTTIVIEGISKELVGR